MNEAVSTASDQIKSYYTTIANANDIPASNVHVEFSKKNPLPSQAELPEGKIDVETVNNELKQDGLSIPDSWNVQSASPACNVVAKAKNDLGS